jgi:hypothetical protein
MDPFELLEKRVSRLGNHHQKYLHTIYRFKDSLIQALESSGNMMQVHLWRSSSSPSEEMRIIANLFDEPRKKIHHISCYYALQFLHMNFRNLDILELGIASGTSLPEDYHNFMMQVGKDFRELTRVYMSNLVDIYLPGQIRPEFFICSVGTRADQDDIDVGIIASDQSDTPLLEQAFRKIAQDMLVYATPLHMYLSEHVGDHFYTTTIKQYKNLLSKQIQDIVILSELLNAKLILGSEKLFDKFQKEIIHKYFYYQHQDVRYHEGFLRGILGEARALLIKPLNTDAISPKDDALRILKSVIYAKKAILCIDEVNAWDIMQKLIQHEPEVATQYELLFKSASFLETFKFMLQLFVIQEDTFRLEEIDNEQLTLIAARMGYEPVGTVRAWDQLITDYYRYVKEVRRICDQIINGISQHLSKVSLFIKLLSKTRWDANGNYIGSMPKDFIHLARFFEGTKYWDDLLSLLQTEIKIVNAFIVGFQDLEETQRKRTIQRYIEWANFSPLTIIRLITILFKNEQSILGIKIAEEMNIAFLKYFADMPLITARFCLIYSYYPQFVHEYLQYFPESHFELLDIILSKPVHDDKIKEYQDQLKELCKIHKWSSHYFHRYFYRIILYHPEYLKSLTKRNQLAKIATGLLAMVDRYPAIKQKKQYLADYYDLEFLRVGIGTMNGVDMNETNREFTEFCDNYMKKLFDICAEEIEKERKSDSDVPSTDRLAILAAGGHGRGKAYDDDYDLIAILDTDNQQVFEHATRIVSRMNREILKRGVLPHYRLGEILEGFVSPVSKITAYLASDVEDGFIDLSQLLGARIIIGGDLMRSVIHQKILDRFIYSDKDRYIKRMTAEIKSRQKSVAECDKDTCNIKETKGGLRDIEAIALMLKAYLGITDPIVKDFFREIKIYLPDLAKEIDSLNDCLYILRTFRDLYRITVAAEDTLNTDYFSRLATVFKQCNHPEWHDQEAIKLKIQSTLLLSEKSCNSVIDYLLQRIS